MNIKDEIIKQTNGGLDIFVRLYGQAVYENAMVAAEGSVCVPQPGNAA